MKKHVQELENKLKVSEELVTQLKTQNSQLMGMIVEANHNSVKKSEKFICRI